MRDGHNPMSNKRVSPLPEVVICVICHLPDLRDAYHKTRLEVIATSLTSARKNAGMDAAFLIWDNGSCNAARKFYRAFAPDYLIESANVGKTTARTIIGRMFPPDTYLAIADDDILYYPDWLRKSKDLYDWFPGCGSVTGYAVRTNQRWGNVKTLQWARGNARVYTGRFIPAEWEMDFCKSIGRDYAAHVAKTEQDLDTLIEYKKVKAYATSHHCQFLTRAKVITKFTQFDGLAMADEKPFDELMDKYGLRLATTERLTRHIGNVLDDEIRAEAEQMGVYSNGK